MTTIELIDQLKELPEDFEIRFGFSGSKYYEFDIDNLKSVSTCNQLIIFNLEEF